MKRVLNAYAVKFRALLRQVGARKLDKGIQWLVENSGALQRNDLSPSEALESMCRKTRLRISRCSKMPDAQGRGAPIVFVCDAGLGGLARWLRAAGYVAHWREGVDDPELIEEAREKAAILLTTDSGMMERRVLRDGHLPAIWLSPGLTKTQQLQSVLIECNLPLRTPRCMNCGGELERVDKRLFAERIPPKTYLWRDDFYQCKDCGKLLWYGTHWRKIARELGGSR